MVVDCGDGTCGGCVTCDGGGFWLKDVERRSGCVCDCVCMNVFLIALKDAVVVACVQVLVEIHVHVHVHGDISSITITTGWWKRSGRRARIEMIHIHIHVNVSVDVHVDVHHGSFGWRRMRSGAHMRMDVTV